MRLEYNVVKNAQYGYAPTHTGVDEKEKTGENNHHHPVGVIYQRFVSPPWKHKKFSFSSGFISLILGEGA